MSRPIERRTTVLLIGHSDSDADQLEAILEAAAPMTFEVSRTADLGDATQVAEEHAR